eukprot:115143-Pyramimonas_sp.AAC.1
MSSDALRSSKFPTSSTSICPYKISVDVHLAASMPTETDLFVEFVLSNDSRSRISFKSSQQRRRHYRPLLTLTPLLTRRRAGIHGAAGGAARVLCAGPCVARCD